MLFRSRADQYVFDERNRRTPAPQPAAPAPQAPTPGPSTQPQTPQTSAGPSQRRRTTSTTTSTSQTQTPPRTNPPCNTSQTYQTTTRRIQYRLCQRTHLPQYPRTLRWLHSRLSTLNLATSTRPLPRYALRRLTPCREPQHGTRHSPRSPRILWKMTLSWFPMNELRIQPFTQTRTPYPSLPKYG